MEPDTRIRDDSEIAVKLISFLKAGDRIRTGDVQLGKLAFYH